MDRRAHWEHVYETKSPVAVSWYAEHLVDSLALIREVASPGTRILDVGGGASTLVDDLLAAGYSKLTVLDVSQAALDIARARLGERAARVRWLRADIITAGLPPAAFDVWHDRAVFHFLTGAAERRAYVDALRGSLACGGHVVIGAFSLHGPKRCSGLDVVQYDAAGLARELGVGFTLSKALERVHVTPNGGQQQFVVCRFQRAS